MEKFIFELSVLIVSAAALSYLAVLLRQPVIIAYILCGVLVGPWGTGWVKDVDFITAMSQLGITLLLFLAGTCLHPRHLVSLFKKTAIVTISGSLISFCIAFIFAYLFKFNTIDCIYIGLALMFSSTILAVKLLPTTKLHHGKMGAMCIGVLIAQDLIAIAILVLIRGIKVNELSVIGLVMLLIRFLGVLGFAIFFERYILRKVIERVDRFHETIFILGLAWCFGVASLSNKLGLSYEIGAFLAGVALARHPISFFISEKLKPLRDFFLVLFFFALGANMDINVMRDIILPSLALTALFTILKPWFFKKFFIFAGEDPAFAREAGIRLGQLSEFSLLIAILAFKLGHISNSASQLIQLVTILSLVASSYIVVFTYPTPIGTSDKLIKD